MLRSERFPFILSSPGPHPSGAIPFCRNGVPLEGSEQAFLVLDQSNFLSEENFAGVCGCASAPRIHADLPGG